MIKIITDSSCDMPRHYETDYNIGIAPLQVTIDGKTFLEWYELTSAEFFSLLENSKDTPKTALAGPDRFLEQYRKAVEEGFDQALVITIPAAASGTNQAAKIASEMFREEYPDFEITVLDSQYLCYPYGYLVVEAARMAQEGASKEEVIQRIRYLQKHYVAYFAVDTLEYLRRGGRINMAKAVMGTLLDLKPILTLRSGLVEQVEMVRGSKKVMARLVELLQQGKTDLPFEKMFVGHLGAPDKAKQLEDRLQAAFGVDEFEEFEVGVVVGAHAGPGFLAVFAINPAVENDWVREDI